MRLLSSHPTVAEINLTTFAGNIKVFKRRLENVLLLAVVKTNAYGHGVLDISNKAVAAGVDRLGVTTVDVGVLLRESGITLPIQLLTSVLPERARDVVVFELTASVSTEALAYKLSEMAVREKKTVDVHLKIDTGLHRFGVNPVDALAFCQKTYNLPGLKWEGIYTHFSSADEGEWVTTESQYKVFMDTIAILADHGFIFPIRHVAGSTIAIERADMHLDMVRPGIALFGYHPAERQENLITLKRVMTLRTKVLQTMILPAHTNVGYGGNYQTSSEEKLAVLPIGHGDGYARVLSNVGEVLVKGERASIVGIIALDQTIIDVTHIPDVDVGDDVVLIGNMLDDEITGREVAGWMGSIVDEVVSSLMQRIPRKYV